MEINNDKWLDGWGQMLVDIWREKIGRLRVYDTGNLYNSVVLMNFVVGDATYHADFTFPVYGIYVDKGTGREISRGNSGDLGFTPTRMPQPWYSPKFYASFMRLKEFMEVSYSNEALILIRESLENN